MHNRNFYQNSGILHKFIYYFRENFIDLDCIPLNMAIIHILLFDYN